MPGSDGAGLLAQRREVRFPNGRAFATPILLPSYSSKGFPQVKKILEATSENIYGPILVSAYDIHHRHISGDLSFSPLVFLDSGGYEASKETDLSDIGDTEYRPGKWSSEMHDEVLTSWNPQVPSVLISYDHPKERLSVSKQIERASNIAMPRDDLIPELLIKPEGEGNIRVKVGSITPHVHALAKFPVIGVTEKEIGSGLLDRMVNLARLRLALTKAGLDTPIHVFGSLDTLSSFAYFLAGADIFDGLTWLRFAYDQGQTVYRQNFGALRVGMTENSDIIEAFCWSHNYRYLNDMQLQMSRYLRERSFDCFEYNRDFLNKAYEGMNARLEAG